MLRFGASSKWLAATWLRSPKPCRLYATSTIRVATRDIDAQLLSPQKSPEPERKSQVVVTTASHSSIKTTDKWRPEQLQRLTALVQKHKESNAASPVWQSVAQQLGKPAWECYVAWDALVRERSTRWTAPMNRRLVAAHTNFGEDWERISGELGGVFCAQACQRQFKLLREQKRAGLRPTKLVPARSAAAPNVASRLRPRSIWSEEEDALLLELHRKFMRKTRSPWKHIAAEMGGHRSPAQCLYHMRTLLARQVHEQQGVREKASPAAWTEQEQDRLRELVACVAFQTTRIDWNEIRETMGTHRSSWEYQEAWRRRTQELGEKARRVWTPEEVKRLTWVLSTLAEETNAEALQAPQRKRGIDWFVVAARLGAHRTPVQCRFYSRKLSIASN